MSDTEEEGTFDKEAEREKLRKQLEREEEERQSTQHMSELLLKGATMTNKHCDTCGDPLFRYEGQEFCPTCSQAGGEGQQAAARAGTGEGAGAAEGSAEPSSAPESASIDRVETGAPAGGGEANSPDTGQRTPGGAADQRPAPRAGGTAAGQAGGGAGGAAGVHGNVTDARAALARKLSTLARQAEATDDVGRSRELLAAAREAAEALAAIDDVGR